VIRLPWRQPTPLPSPYFSSARTTSMRAPLCFVAAARVQLLGFRQKLASPLSPPVAEQARQAQPFPCPLPPAPPRAVPGQPAVPPVHQQARPSAARCRSSARLLRGPRSPARAPVRPQGAQHRPSTSRRVRVARSPIQQSGLCAAARALFSGRTHNVLGEQHPCFAVISRDPPPSAAQCPHTHRRR
jgi:hypothetical protein